MYSSGRDYTDREGNKVHTEQMECYRFNLPFARKFPKSPSPSGEMKKTAYTVKVDEYGNRSLVATGETDTYSIIQSYKDECDVCKLIERYQQGDVSALQRVQAIYCDTTQYPHSLMEARQAYDDAMKAFNLLSEEAKAYYGTPEAFLERLHKGDVYKSPDAVSTEDVNE